MIYAGGFGEREALCHQKKVTERVLVTPFHAEQSLVQAKPKKTATLRPATPHQIKQRAHQSCGLIIKPSLPKTTSTFILPQCLALHSSVINRQNMSSSNQPSIEAKLVVLGSQAVGKTSLVHRFVHHSFAPPASMTSTIGASFITKRVTDADSGTVVRLQIWDTAGQERFRSISKLYYRGEIVQ
jgi:hypothetical protein